jgi:hypothetical protein
VHGQFSAAAQVRRRLLLPAQLFHSRDLHGGLLLPGGSAEQIPCPIGHYCATTALAAATECPVNKFADSQGMTSCVPCPDGTETRSSGAASSTDCFEPPVPVARTHVSSAKDIFPRLASSLAGLLAAVLAVWLRRVCMDRSCRPFPLADQVRRNLRLQLGLSHTPDARVFIERIEELAHAVAKAGGPSLNDDPERFGQLLAQAIAREVREALSAARYCWGMLLNPFPCRGCQSFELRPGSLVTQRDAIVSSFLEVFEASEAPSLSPREAQRSVAIIARRGSRPELSQPLL